MNKVLVIVVLFSLGLVEAAMPSVRQRAFAFARIFQQQAPSKVSISDLVQMHKELPCASFKTSPLLGAVCVFNGTVARYLQQDDKLAKSFFNQRLPEPVHYTVADGNAARYLNVQLLGELFALHASGDLYKKEFFQSEIFQKWHSQYTGSKDIKGFAGLVKDVLNRMKKEPDQEKVREILLSAIYFKADTANDLTLFLQASGTVLEGNASSESKRLMKKYADIFLALTVNKNLSVAFLKAEEVVELRGFCAEKLLWSLINVIFYNPKTGLLDTAMLPSSLTCLPALITFITQHPDPKISRYYSLAAENFLQLVHGIDGVDYKRGTVEVRARRTEVLKVLNHLFSTKASTYKDFGNMLSSGEKGKIFLQEPHDTDDYGQVELKHSYSDLLLNVISGELHFSDGHGFFVFDKQGESDIRNILEKIKKLEEELGLGSSESLVRLIPGWLHQSIDWRNNSVEQVDMFLKKNKVTEAELNELSQGLAEKKCTLLHTAIEQERADLVSYFLERGINPNGLDSNGDSSLHLSVKGENQEEIVQLLITAGALINEKNNSGETALLVASRSRLYRCRELVQLLITAGALINEKNNHGDTALLAASYHGRRDIVELLLAAGALINGKNNDGDTALLVASRYGCREVVKLLLAAEALVNEKNKRGDTALLLASWYEHREVVELLLAAGADPVCFRSKLILMALALKNYLS